MGLINSLIEEYEYFKRKYINTYRKVNRPIQEVFNIVIEQGFYYRQDFMCFALRDAYRANYISKDEYLEYKKQVCEYIGDSITLHALLERNNRRSDFSTRQGIYMNWANRPKFG